MPLNTRVYRKLTYNYFGDETMYFKRIKNLRIDNDLTQKAIAIELGISQQTYSDYEKGKYDIPNEMILKIADYYKVSIDYLFERTNNPKVNKV